MSDNKDGSGSDLDVFEGLTKKPAAKPSFPPPAPPGARPVAPPPARVKATMIGIAPPPVAPPQAPLPPPGPSRPSMPGLPPPPPSMSNAPPSMRGLPPVVPPPSRPPPTGTVPAPLPPPRSAPPPVPPPNKTGPGPLSASAAPPVDMDWDDEDEKTNIYDKVDGPSMPSGRPLPAAGAPVSKMGAAAALAAGSGGAAAMAPPPPAPLPRPAPITVPPAAPLPPAAAPPARGSGRADPTQVLKPQQASSGGRGGLFAALAVLGIAGAAAAFFVLQPKQGTLVVAVKSSGRPLSEVEVFIGDKKVCSSVPCKVPNIDKGTVPVKAVAVGYEPGSELVAVRAGEESPVTIELAKGRDGGGDTASAKGTGFKVSGPAHVKLAVDGKELGPLPQELKNLTPGEHKLKFFSSDRYKVDERTVTVAEGEVKDLGPVKLPVVKGKATLTLETQAALVTLVSGTERKAVRTFPISLDIDTSKTWTVEATRPGYIDFRQPITFEDEAEKTITIVLMKKGEKKDDKDKKEPDKKDPPAAESGSATLSINSIPPSNCILDGRPLGSTPKAGVSVSAGTHTVVFVHPEHGRKSVSVTVKGGESKSVGVRF